MVQTDWFGICYIGGTLGLVAFTWTHKRLKDSEKSIVLLLITFFLGFHALYNLNRGLFRRRLDPDLPTKEAFPARPQLSVRGSFSADHSLSNRKYCVDNFRRRIYLPGILTRGETLYFQEGPEGGLASLLETQRATKYGHEKIANIYLDFDRLLPHTSIYRISGLQNKLLRHELHQLSRSAEAVLFHVTRPLDDPEGILGVVKEMNNGHVFVVVFSNGVGVPANLANQVVQCREFSEFEQPTIVQKECN